MKRLFLFAAFLCAGRLMAQSIKPEEAAKHVGDSTTVCGKIFGAKFLENSGKQPTLLNMGAAYPDQPLTILIWGSDRKNFSYKPEDKLVDKEVCITGKILLYRDKPEIIVENESQIKLQ